jgi:LysM repeat protein
MPQRPLIVKKRRSLTKARQRTRVVVLLTIALLVVLPGCGDAGFDGDDPGATAGDPSEAQLRPSTERERQRRQAAAGTLEERVEDARLTSRVLEQLADDSQLRRYTFEAEAIAGRVYVRGDVGTHAMRERVEDVIGGVDGVRGIVNEVGSAEPAPPSLEPDVPEDLIESPPIAEEIPEEDPQVEPEPEPEPAQATEEFHTVRSGESLWTIARQHNTSIANIRRLNNLTSDNLRPGQRIRVR